jgi:hypothetical protein
MRIQPASFGCVGFAVWLCACTGAETHAAAPSDGGALGAAPIPRAERPAIPAAAPIGPPPTAAGGAASPPPAVSARYPGSGFVVHEWGTNTVVMGSNGSLQRGLHHEGDDLPDFVFDRLKQGDLLGFPALDKMETPVDYFYSDRPRSVSVRVDMPHGVLTQWYPAAAAFSPAILNASSGPIPIIDPVSSVHYPYATQGCLDKYADFGSGMLDWGSVEILSRDETLNAALPPAPIDRFSWSYARDVAANDVRVRNPMARSSDAAMTVRSAAQTERFLFYRGLGRFEPPMRVSTASADGTEIVQISMQQAIPGPVWLLNVAADAGAIRRFDSSAELTGALPDLRDAPPLDVFVDDLAKEMTDALSGTGLYRDEASAMVNTWRHQWFRTPGVRVLYFAPRSWLEREVSLSITPAPDAEVRVMVMRVELLTRDVENRDLAATLDVGTAADASARDYFHALGRFAEPRLRRALSLLGGRASAQAQAFLGEIEAPNATGSLEE